MFGNEVNDAARRFQHDKRQPEMPEDTECAAAAAAIDFEFRLDFRFKNFQVFVDAPRGHAAEFAVDQRQVGKDRQAQRQNQQRAECRSTATSDFTQSQLRRSRSSTALHLAAVGLVIVSQQMQDAMQNQDLKLFWATFGHIALALRRGYRGG